MFVERMDVPITEKEGLNDYATWSRGLITELEQADVVDAEITVTFNHHVVPRDFDLLVENYQLEINTLQVEYVGKNENGQSETWTGFIRNHYGIDVTLLDDAVQEQTSIDITQPHGIVAVHGHLPVDQLEHLNEDNRVFLADPIASYIELVASQDVDVQEALSNAREQREIKIRQQQERQHTQSSSEGEEDTVTDVFQAYPELQPQLTTKVRNFWHLIKE